MGVRHIVLLSFPEGTTAAEVEAVASGLAALPPQIPEIRSYLFGPDIGLNDRNADFGLVAEFDSVDDHRAYLDHPAHRAFVADHLEPLGAVRLAVQMHT